MLPAERFYSSIKNHIVLTLKARIDYFAYFLQEQMGQDHFTAAQILDCFNACALSPPASLASHLSNGTKGKPPTYLKATTGYRLERHTRDRIAGELGAEVHTVQISAELRQLEAHVSEGPGKEWLKEALDCFGVEAYRASLLMIWVWTLDHLFNLILSHHIASFNAALSAHPDQRTVKKVGIISKRDDFTLLGEEMFVELCRTAGIISPDVRKILIEKLGIRNSAAHPSGVKISRHKAIDFADDLATNVVLKYPV